MTAQQGDRNLSAQLPFPTQDFPSAHLEAGSGSRLFMPRYEGLALNTKRRYVQSPFAIWKGGRFAMRCFYTILLGMISVGQIGQAQGTEDWRQALNSTSVTMGTIRRTLLNQDVVIAGSMYKYSDGSTTFQNWSVAHEQGEYYESDGLSFGSRLSGVYRGKVAKVVAIQVNELKRGKRQRNALGEILSDDDAVNPYFDIVVRFEDGKLAMLTDYCQNLAHSDDIELASQSRALAQELTKELPLIIGKHVFAVAFSEMFSADTRLDQMVGLYRDPDKLLSDAPLLEPLEIVAARYVDPDGVVLKLKLPDERNALTFTSQDDIQRAAARSKSLLEKISGRLLSELPPVSAKEIEAIRHREIFKGMTEISVNCALGFPTSENEWASLGKQLIYSRSVYSRVYLDREGKVVDWDINH